MERRAFQRPHTLDEVARRVALGEPWAMALPEFLDTFYLALRGANTSDPQHCLDAEPRRVDDYLHQAFMGAIGEHLARRWHLMVPAWTADPSRILSEPHFDCATIEGHERLRVESPAAFRERNIFTEAEPLRRARFPSVALYTRDVARGRQWTPGAMAAMSVVAPLHRWPGLAPLDAVT